MNELLARIIEAHGMGMGMRAILRREKRLSSEANFLL